MLLSGQDALPRLPVPDLTVTLSKYLRSLGPVPDVTAADVARNERLAAAFASSSVAAELQRLLRERDAREPNSWLETWWNRLAYLEYRESVVINVSFAMPFRPFPLGSDVSRNRRAALLTRAMLEYKVLIDTRALPPEPQPMDQLSYTRFFNACRVPRPGCDVQHRYQETPNDLVVICQGRFWHVQLDAAAPLPSIGSLEQSFHWISEASVARGGADAVGLCTGMHRDDWAALHARLISLGNLPFLELIERCAFVVCLDPEEIGWDLQHHMEELLMGECHNRWYDKPIQLVVGSGQRAGIIGEHSPVDGEPVARMSDWIVDREVELHVEASRQVDRGSKVEPPRPLTWNLGGDAWLEAEMKRARLELQQARENLESFQLEFHGYGKEQVKSLAHCSPDGWIQASLHLAHLRLHGALAPTYESASTRRFRAGRTETGRTLTPEIADWAHAMVAAAPGSDRPSLKHLLIRATEAHVAYMKDAGQGAGCDRHLLALRLLAAEHGLEHPFLSDPCHAKSSRWRMSTSQLPVRNLAIGFGPVIPEGYGICYQVHPHRLRFSITNFRADGRTSSHRLASEIVQALRDMMGLFLEAKL